MGWLLLCPGMSTLLLPSDILDKGLSVTQLVQGNIELGKEEVYVHLGARRTQNMIIFPYLLNNTRIVKICIIMGFTTSTRISKAHIFSTHYLFNFTGFFVHWFLNALFSVMLSGSESILDSIIVSCILEMFI